MLVASLTTSAMTTQIKEQERIRREAEMEKMRGNLLRAVSHDLRTPLTSIIGSSSAILDGPAALPPQAQRRMIEDIREDAEDLLRMVENLLSITRINGEAARIKAQPEAVEEVVAESVRKFKKRFPSLPVSIRMPDEMLMVRMDPILIEQVIVNLLENVVMHAQTRRAPNSPSSTGATNASSPCLTMAAAFRKARCPTCSTAISRGRSIRSRTRRAPWASGFRSACPSCVRMAARCARKIDRPAARRCALRCPSTRTSPAQRHKRIG